MFHTVTIYDETLPGERTASLRLDLLCSTITLRELIRRRVYEEVREHHAAPPAAALRGPVLPTALEAELNCTAEKAAQPRVSWEAQYEKAVAAFERGGFFVLAGDRQVEHLDDEITLSVSTEVSFIKLVALAGG